MGPSTIMQVAAAARFRDDYGASVTQLSTHVTPFARSWRLPVVQSLKIATIGGQYNAD